MLNRILRAHIRLSLGGVERIRANQRPAPLSPIDYDTARFDRNLPARRTTASITLDGRLDEAAWKTAEVATNFIQVQPQTGQPAVDQTEVMVLYDDTNLYVGGPLLRLGPVRIGSTTLEEDFESNNTDMFGFVVDSLNDRVSGFEFFINPAGARHDAQIFREAS